MVIEQELTALTIGKVPKRITESELKNYFATFGSISKVSLFRASSQGSSFGVASLMADKNAASGILSQKDHFFKGAFLAVSETKKKQPILSKQESSKIRKILFINGLNPTTKIETLRDYLGQFGTIQHLVLQTHENTGFNRGFSRIIFQEAGATDVFAAQTTHTLDNATINFNIFEIPIVQLQQMNQNFKSKATLSLNEGHIKKDLQEQESQISKIEEQQENGLIEMPKEQEEVQASHEESKARAIVPLVCYHGREILGAFLNFRTFKKVDVDVMGKEELILLASIYRTKVDLSRSYVPLRKKEEANIAMLDSKFHLSQEIDIGQVQAMFTFINRPGKC